MDAQILEVNDAMNTLACMLLDSISELSYDDADFVIDVVEQYLSQIPGDEENKRRIVRRYASLIVSDIRKQIYEHMDRKTQDVHIIQKDLILFRKFVKNVKEDGRVRYDKPFTDKSNIRSICLPGIRSHIILRTLLTVIPNDSSRSFWKKTRMLSVGLNRL